MHISEGVLSAPVLIGGAIGGAALLAAGMKKMPWEHLMTTALLSAAFFCASLVHLNIGLADVHLILNGLLGCILGFAAVPAIFVALCLQALLFHFGGITTLGVNTCIMGLPAILSAWAFRPLLRHALPARREEREPEACPANAKRNKILWISGAFLCGSCSVALSALLESLALLLSDGYFETAALAVVTVHIPIMLLEGVVTVFIVGLIRKEKPDMLRFILNGGKTSGNSQADA